MFPAALSGEFGRQLLFGRCLDASQTLEIPDTVENCFHREEGAVFMADLAPVDKLELQILIDDVADPHSSVPDYAESEMGFLMRTGKMPVAAAKCLCCATHGFSCLVTAHRGSQKHTVLFDTGPEPYAFTRNCERLGADLSAVEGIILSHGHFDHAGGLLTALDLIHERNGRHPVSLYVHPDAFRSHAWAMSSEMMLPFEDIPGPELLTSHGASVKKSRTPQTILDDMFYISGEIPRVTPFERGFPGHLRRTADGKDWEPDPLITDEHFLTANVAGKGLVVFSGCSHAGVINILKCAQAESPQTPLYGFVGGLHLAGMLWEPIIRQTVEAMTEFHLKFIAVGHCTGWRAENAIMNTFGDQIVAPCAVGKRYVI